MTIFQPNDIAILNMQVGIKTFGSSPTIRMDIIKYQFIGNELN